MMFISLLFIASAHGFSDREYALANEDKSCAASGFSRITTKAECEKAATAVGAWDTSAAPMPDHVALSGCYIADELYFSTPEGDDNDAAVQAEFFALCAGAADSSDDNDWDDEWDRSARTSTGTTTPAPTAAPGKKTYETKVSMTVDLACTNDNQELAQNEASAALGAYCGDGVSVTTTSECGSIKLTSTITYDEDAKAASTNLQNLESQLESGGNSVATIFSAANGWNQVQPTGISANTVDTTDLSVGSRAAGASKLLGVALALAMAGAVAL